MFSKVFLIGQVAGEPKSGFSSGDVLWTNLLMGVFKSSNLTFGNANFIPCMFWADEALEVNRTVARNDLLFIVGRINTYKDKFRQLRPQITVDYWEKVDSLCTINKLIGPYLEKFKEEYEQDRLIDNEGFEQPEKG